MLVSIKTENVKQNSRAVVVLLSLALMGFLGQLGHAHAVEGCQQKKGKKKPIQSLEGVGGRGNLEQRV